MIQDLPYLTLIVYLFTFKVVNCGFPPRPKNGTFIGNETTFRSELEFRCDEGFELQGSAKRMCTTDKSWTGKEVTCNGKCIRNRLFLRFYFRSHFLTVHFEA